MFNLWRKVSNTTIFLIGSVTDENKETAPPTAASVAEELLSLWQNSRPDHNCNSVVCEVENSAWGQRPPLLTSPVRMRMNHRWIDLLGPILIQVVTYLQTMVIFINL